MRYIVDDGTGWDHRPYWRYLDSVRLSMPDALGQFAANPANHDLEHPSSLHDSWLESWSVSEIPHPDHKAKRSIHIECRLLGSRHDRIIILAYKQVTSHQILWAVDATGSRRLGHGDLLIHEVLVLDDGLFSHELLFSNGSIFQVEFREFEHRVNSIAA